MAVEGEAVAVVAEDLVGVVVSAVEAGEAEGEVVVDVAEEDSGMVICKHRRIFEPDHPLTIIWEVTKAMQSEANDLTQTSCVAGTIMCRKVLLKYMLL